MTDAQENENLVAKLYTNDVTPSLGDTISTYIEAVNYSDIILDSINWGFSVDGSSFTAIYPTMTFGFLSETSETIYGFYITDSTESILIGASKFPAMKEADSFHAVVVLSLKLLLRN